MIEIAAAALVPALVLLVAAMLQHDAEFRRAVTRTFIPLTLLWFAPYWLTGRTPAPLNYLAAQIVPWKSAAAMERWITPLLIVRNTLLSDVVLQFLPWRELVTEAWRHGHLPLLDRFAGAGSPLWGNPQAAVLAPTTILGLPFSTFAWPLFAAVVKVLTALTGMYLFLRAEERTDAAARFGAIAYAFCGFAFAFMLFPLTNVTTLLPWMLLAIRRAADEQWRGVVFAAIVTALIFLGGHPESVLHVAIIAVPYGIARTRGRRSLMMLGWAALIGVLIAAPVVLPFVRMMPLTERAARDQSFFKAPALTATNLLSFVFPAHFEYSATRTDGANFNEMATQYAGFAAFVLAVFAAIRDTRRQRFWIVMFAILSITAFDVIPLGVPVLHGRIRFVLAFITAVLAASGFDLVRERPHAVRAIAGAGIAIIAASMFVHWQDYVRFAIAPIVVASAIAAAVAALLLSFGSYRFLWLALFADLAILGMTSHPPAERAQSYPATPVIEFLRRAPGPYRFVGFEGALFPNTGGMFGLEDIRVHDPMAFEPYAAELQRGGYDRRSYFEVFRRLPAHALADRLGVRYIIAPPDARGPLRVAYRGSDAVVFENPSAMPRFALQTAGKIDVLRYDDGGAEVRVVAAKAGELRASFAALPGWRLVRNGREWPLRSDHALLFWSVPAGESDFVLSYWPAGLTLGIALFLIGITLLLHAVWLSAITRSSSACAVLSSPSAQSAPGLMCL